ncbi:hypothetical protein ABE488_05640 [Luteimonas sp. TWI662]|uniref:hypothetical protein n=2 Tax=Luteimonas TaxID=83614 RepID=UPI0032092A16
MHVLTSLDSLHRKLNAMTAQRMRAGVTLDQVDRLDHLLQSITALGDVLAMGDVPVLHKETVPTIGHAVFRAGCEAREILDTFDVPRPDADASDATVEESDDPMDAAAAARAAKEEDVRRRLDEARTPEELNAVLADSYFDKIRQVLADGPGGDIEDEDEDE